MKEIVQVACFSFSYSVVFYKRLTLASRVDMLEGESLHFFPVNDTHLNGIEIFLCFHRYVKSRNDEQLRNPNFKGDLKKTCAPEDMNGNEPVIPCGLIAWSLFNDTYGFSIKNKGLPINRKNISWPSDKKHKFGSKVFPKNFQKGSLIGGGSLNESIPVSADYCPLFHLIIIIPFPHFYCYLNYFGYFTCR